MSETENLILEKRLIGKSFYEMNESESRYATDKIMLRCSAVTGCELPFTELFAEELSDAIIDLFGMGYGDLTLEEVLLAMQLNLKTKMKMPTGIELDEVPFAGRTVNATFLSKVLDNYMVLRNYLDRRFQNLIDGY